MAKQAILITAYRDEACLFRLIRHFSDESHFRIFIHIDAKSKELDEERIHALGIKSLVCIRKYRICWGSIRHLLAVLDLMKLAMGDPEVGYVHVVSGLDMAIRSASRFVDKFENCQISYCDIEYQGHIRGREDWYGQWRVPSTIRFRGTSRIDRLFLSLQHLFHLQRKMIGEVAVSRLSVGLIWGSHPRKACEQFIAFAERHPKFMRALNTTTIPEETFFATVAYEENLPRAPEGYLRYSVWTNERGWPGVLDERDFEDMTKSDCFFARKIDSVKSAGLIRLIESGLSDK